MVYITAAIQAYLMEVFDTLDNVMAHSKKKRITPRHFMLALATDPDLATKFNPNPIIRGAGVLGGIHPALVAPPNMRKKVVAVPG